MANSYEYFMKADLSGYLGKWIAICDERIVSTGDSPKEVFNHAKKSCPNKKPFLAKVPEKEAMIF